jgi:hypothetical protein
VKQKRTPGKGVGLAQLKGFNGMECKAIFSRNLEENFVFLCPEEVKGQARQLLDQMKKLMHFLLSVDDFTEAEIDEFAKLVDETQSNWIRNGKYCNEEYLSAQICA